MQTTNGIRFEPVGQEIDRSAVDQDCSPHTPLTHACHEESWTTLMTCHEESWTTLMTDGTPPKLIVLDHDKRQRKDPLAADRSESMSDSVM